MKKSFRFSRARYFFAEVVAVSLAVAFSSSAAAQANPSAPQKIKPAGVEKRGEPLSKMPAKTVENCIKESALHSGKVVKITGTVKQVCKAKGCWFTLAGRGDETIRITSQGYKFFVPTNADGRRATVEGVFGVKELSAEMAQHYEDDRVAGTQEVPKKITTHTKEYSLAATAVELE